MLDDTKITNNGQRLLGLINTPLHHLPLFLEEKAVEVGVISMKDSYLEFNFPIQNKASFNFTELTFVLSNQLAAMLGCYPII